MERLTEERGEKTWQLFHIGWYVNLVLFILVLILAGKAYYESTDNSLFMGLIVLASILLIGAGISRYQARLESQHLELKLAIKDLEKALGAKKSGAE